MKFFLRFGFLTMLVAISLGYPSLRTADIERDPEEIGDFFEGDMDLNDLQSDALENPVISRNGRLHHTYRWPGNTIIYEISQDFDDEHRDYIIKGTKMIESVTCLRFFAKESSQKTDDYINITAADSGCHSKVGRVGGAQQLNLQIYPLDSGCFRLGSIVHEFLHALGFYHQQSAHDRDQYVTIVHDNILEGKEHNFNVYTRMQITDYEVPYDYGSVMHYSSTAFTKSSGEKTIVPKDPEAAIGQRAKISDADIKKVNLMYNCPSFAI